ncbi:MAG: hypothetical protein H6Q06_1324, partial [Acidobacteria bacterium]|nr:hypothetical protein [Acidobacteriota bacterium]
TVATNQGTGNQIRLNLGPRQTLRIETLGTASLKAGYAIVRNLEATTAFPDDYDVGVTVYFEIARGGAVIDTISVPVGQPTAYWTFPVQTAISQELVTGFAIVNPDEKTSRSIKLDLWQAGATPSSAATFYDTYTLNLNSKEQKAVYLNQLFPNLSSFRGSLEAESLNQQSVAVIALLQSPTPTGLQYATMVPTYFDSLVRNSTIVFAQGFALDADIPVSDYLDEDSRPWDIEYSEVITGSASRELTTLNGAKLASIGSIDYESFDNLTLKYVQGLPYNLDRIDMSDGSSNLQVDFAFAVKTNLGRYAKVRVSRVISEDTGKSLGLEVYVYR